LGTGDLKSRAGDAGRKRTATGSGSRERVGNVSNVLVVAALLALLGREREAAYAWRQPW